LDYFQEEQISRKDRFGCLFIAFPQFLRDHGVDCTSWGLIRHNELQNGSTAGNTNEETKEDEESARNSLKQSGKSSKAKR
jgi:hypothetical protein